MGEKRRLFRRDRPTVLGLRSSSSSSMNGGGTSCSSSGGGVRTAAAAAADSSTHPNAGGYTRLNLQKQKKLASWFRSEKSQDSDFFRNRARKFKSILVLSMLQVIK